MSDYQENKNDTTTIDIVQAVEVFVAAIDFLAGDRSCALGVANNTNYEFELVHVKHDHGKFGENGEPSSVLPAKSANVFYARDKGIATGVEGLVLYKAKGTDLLVSLWWNNPWAGNNSCGASAYSELTEGMGLFEMIDHMRKEVPLRVTTVCGEGNHSKNYYEVFSR